MLTISNCEHPVASSSIFRSARSASSAVPCIADHGSTLLLYLQHALGTTCPSAPVSAASRASRRCSTTDFGLGRAASCAHPEGRRQTASKPCRLSRPRARHAAAATTGSVFCTAPAPFRPRRRREGRGRRTRRIGGARLPGRRIAGCARAGRAQAPGAGLADTASLGRLVPRVPSVQHAADGPWPFCRRQGGPRRPVTAGRAVCLRIAGPAGRRRALGRGRGPRSDEARLAGSVRKGGTGAPPFPPSTRTSS